MKKYFNTLFFVTLFLNITYSNSNTYFDFNNLLEENSKTLICQLIGERNISLFKKYSHKNPQKAFFLIVSMHLSILVAKNLLNKASDTIASKISDSIINFCSKAEKKLIDWIEKVNNYKSENEQRNINIIT